MKLVNNLFTLAFALFGVLFLCWGVAQMMYLVPCFNPWSDLFALFAAFVLLGMAWMHHIETRFRHCF
jgi:hypothetical protein